MLFELAAAVLLLAGDHVPRFNIEPVCREIAGRANAPDYGEKCLGKEREAYQQLKARWDAFPAADRSYCAKLAALGGVPSYVELITCLELAQAARNADAMQTKDVSGPARARRGAR